MTTCQNVISTYSIQSTAQKIRRGPYKAEESSSSHVLIPTTKLTGNYEFTDFYLLWEHVHVLFY